jgi:CMP-N-acetylneuraminic acid synthetase
MKNLAVIPARSGSKGISDKNIKDLNGKPLMAYTIEAAQNTNIFDCIHVSTDSALYADIARKLGVDVPFLRSAALSTDAAGTMDAVRFVVNEYINLGQTFETVTILQPTSPLRTSEDIVCAFRVFREKKADSVVSVCETEYSPWLCNILPDNSSLNNFIDLNRVGRRQEMQQYYRINGAIYIQTTELLMRHGNLYGENSYAYIMNKMKSIDIDDEFDFFLAKMLLNYNQ